MWSIHCICMAELSSLMDSQCIPIQAETYLRQNWNLFWTLKQNSVCHHLVSFVCDLHSANLAFTKMSCWSWTFFFFESTHSEALTMHFSPSFTKHFYLSHLHHITVIWPYERPSVEIQDAFLSTHTGCRSLKGKNSHTSNMNGAMCTNQADYFIYLPVGWICHFNDRDNICVEEMRHCWSTSLNLKPQIAG